MKKSPTSKLKLTALHEAGHAVLHIALNLGCQGVTIKPNYHEGSAGAAIHAGEWGQPARQLGEEDDDTATLRMLAEEEFWLRHAVALYAGAEAVRRSGETHWTMGAEDDYRSASDALDRITADEWSHDLLGLIARRRCQVLVEYYWPEIQSVARKLMRSRTIDGETARRTLLKSLNARRGTLRTW